MQSRATPVSIAMPSDEPSLPEFTNAAPLSAAPRMASRLTDDSQMSGRCRATTDRTTSWMAPMMSSRPRPAWMASPAGPFAKARPIATNTPPPWSRAGTVTSRFTTMPRPYWISSATAMPRVIRRTIGTAPPRSVVRRTCVESESSIVTPPVPGLTFASR
jgi:hypothetical protein